MERKPFKLKSGNKTSFKMMGSTEKESPPILTARLKNLFKEDLGTGLNNPSSYDSCIFF